MSITRVSLGSIKSDLIDGVLELIVNIKNPRILAYARGRELLLVGFISPYCHHRRGSCN